MKLIRDIAFITIFLAPSIAWSSSEMPDSITPIKLQRAYTLKNPDANYQIDTTESAGIYVLRLRIPWSSGNYMELAIADNDSFTIYPLYIKASRVETETRQINGRGNKELIIYWYYDENISRWGDWHYYHQRGVIMLDTDSMIDLLRLQTYNSQIAIWETYAPDTIEQQAQRVIIDGGSESVCESYQFALSDTGFSIHETADCPEQEDWDLNHYEITDNNKYEYVFTKSGYVRVK